MGAGIAMEMENLPTGAGEGTGESHKVPQDTRHLRKLRQDQDIVTYIDAFKHTCVLA